MKKLFSFFLGVLFAIGLISFSLSADSILDYLDNIGTDLFGYRPNTDKLSVQSMTNNSITITSPVLKDEFGVTIGHYVLMYSLNPLSEIIADPALISTSREKTFSNLSLSGKDTFTMGLTASDNIDFNKTYYLVSIPKDSAGTLGELSNEICFNLASNFHGEGDSCLKTAMHAAGANMSLANISHIINGSLVTLKWIAVDGSDYVDIFLWNESSNNFDKLTTIAMSRENYSFNVSRDGEHIVKFIPNNGGKEINYTFNVVGTSVKDDSTQATEVRPVEVRPVVVGPKENLILIFVGTLLLYGIYKLLRRKA